MKKFKFLFMFMFCPALFLSCSDEMFVPPALDSFTSTDSSLKPPSEVNATKGRVGSVELSWNPVPNAVQYLVYSAENEWDAFELFDETVDGSCSIEVLQSSGTTMCYKIATVNAAHEISSLSKSVRGITLSKPYVTSIESSELGDSVTIRWYMSEGDREFEDKIDYTINCYANEKSDSPVKSEGNIKGIRDYTLDGLASGTSYYFEVIAQTSFDNNKYESSGRIYGESAKCTLPGPVSDFTVSKGMSAEKVDISFRIPDFTLYRNSDRTYESMPNFFRIYRKELSGQNFVELEEIRFENNSYEPEKVVTYEDESAERGKQYEYKVQSFVDAKRQVTDDRYSVSEVAGGWKIGTVKFSQETEVTYADEINISEISVQLKLDFDEMGQQYRYNRIENRFSTSDGSECGSDSLKMSLHELNSVPVVFKELTEEGFYCSYSVEVLSAENDDVIDRVSLAEKILISSKDVVKINSFKVEDGFADRFVLEWDYNENYSYTISWEDVKENSLAEELSENEINLTADMLDLTESGFARYVHRNVGNGISRKYILKACMGVTKEVACGTVKTIGEPSVELNGYSYSSIKLKWNEVSCADTYVVTAKFGDKEISSKTVSGRGASYECELNEFNGYDFTDANISGRKIDVSVKAVNSAKEEYNSVETHVDAYTVGPAALDVEVPGNSLASRQIRVSWNKIDGARYYAIFRKDYGSAKKMKVASSVYYVYDAEKKALYYSGDPVPEDRALVTVSGNRFIFDDKYVEQINAEDTHGKLQSKIPFGLPYGYIVVPMLNSGDFEFGNDYSVAATKEDVPGYKNLRETVSSASGFGLNVKAEKALKSDVQIIRWDEPYVKGQTAYVYTHKTGSSDSWKKINVPCNTNYCEYRPENLYEPYEYAVVYGSANSVIPSYENYLSDTKDEESPEEPSNRGYLLNIKYDAFYNGTKVEGGYKNDEHYYAEKVTLEPWDYSKKKLGPSAMEVKVLNSNLGGDWHSIAKTDSTAGASHWSSSNPAGTKVIVCDDGLELVPWKNEMVNGYAVNQNGASVGAADGVLKVLRDAKHYYKVTLTSRKLEDDRFVYADANNGSYAYRQISDEELAKCAMLAFTYAFYINDDGKADYSNAGNQFKYGGERKIDSGNGGWVSFNKRERYGLIGGYAGKFHASCWFSEYAPDMLNPMGTSTSFIKISSVRGANFEFRIKGDADNFLYQFVQEPKLVVGFSDPDFPGTEKQIAFKIPDANSITLKVDGRELVSTSDNTVRKQWCPMQVHDNKSYVLHDSFYGWWPEGNK